MVGVSLFHNIPRFFEYRTLDDRVDYWATEIMEDGTYIRVRRWCHNKSILKFMVFLVQFSAWWDRIITTGLLPFAALVFFNLRIYYKIRQVSMFGTFAGFGTL